MKNQLKPSLLTLFLCVNLVAFSQTLTPAFSVKIAFEDKAKHKDTITIGYDPLATNDVDTAFGEQDTWGVPWDSLFEVRVSGGQYAYVTSLGKRVFVSQTTDTIYCYHEASPAISSIAIFGVHFQCKTENFPVKITWDYTQFSGSSCHSWSSIVYNCSSPYPELFPVYRMNLPFGVFNLQTPYYYSQIAGENGYIISTPSNILTPGGGLTTDTIYTFEIRLSSKPDLFNSTWIVSVQDQTQSLLNSQVYPNPAQHEVNITLPEPAWCYVTDLSGKVVENTYLQAGTSTLNVSHLPKGLYLIRLKGKNQRSCYHKIMVE